MNCNKCKNEIRNFEAFYMFFERHPDYVLYNKKEAYLCHNCFKEGYIKDEKHGYNKDWSLDRRKRWDIGNVHYFYCGHKCKVHPERYDPNYMDPPWNKIHLIGIALKEPLMGWMDLGMETRASYHRSLWHAQCAPASVLEILDLVPDVKWYSHKAEGLEPFSESHQS